jgi:hypothetical protein
VVTDPSVEEGVAFIAIRFSPQYSTSSVYSVVPVAESYDSYRQTWQSPRTSQAVKHNAIKKTDTMKISFLLIQVIILHKGIK